MKRFLSILISICMLALMLHVGVAAAEITPEQPTRVACTYVKDSEGYEVQVYYDTLGEAVAASQLENANGRVYIAKSCNYEGDLTITKPTVFACNNDINVIVTMTGTMTLNAPLTIQHGAAFSIADDEACVIVNKGGELMLHNMSLSFTGATYGIKSNTSDVINLDVPWGSLQANDCGTVLSGSFDLDLGVYGDFRTYNCGTAHADGTLDVNMDYRCSMFFQNSTGNGLTANNITMSEQSSITARNCRGNGIVAENITMDASCEIEVTESGKAPAPVQIATFRSLRRAVPETGHGLIVNGKLDMTGAAISAIDNARSGLVVNDLTADSTSTLTATGNGSSGAAPAAVFVTGTARIEAGADVMISDNTGSGLGIADGAKLSMQSGVVKDNGGSDIVNEGSLEISDEIADKAEIDNNGSMKVVKVREEIMAPMLLMRIGFAKITVEDEAGEPAADAAYDLYTARGRKVRTCKADDDGVINTRSLTGGTYYLVPSGEVFDAESAWSFEISGFGKCETLTMTVSDEQ